VQNKILNFEPAIISSAALAPVNLFNCSVTTLTPGGIGFTGTQPYAILKHIRLVNTLTTAAVIVSLYKGATLTSSAATSFAFSSASIPASSYVDWYGQNRFDSGDYLVAAANLSTACLINIEGEIGLS
jgi:hypothetical protein